MEIMISTPIVGKLIREGRITELKQAIQNGDEGMSGLLRWLHRQLRQPTPQREHLEAAVANDDPAEARRLVGLIPFTAAQQRHIDGLISRWEEGRDRVS